MAYTMTGLEKKLMKKYGDSKLFALFSEVIVNSQLHQTSKLRYKYRKPSRLFSRFFLNLNKMKKLGKTRGLDFGPAHCGAVVLRELLGMKVVGLDHSLAIQYLGLQEYLISKGYKIVRRDTYQFPWSEFRDGEFDFIFAFNSLSMQKYVASDKKYMKRRVKELLRISKNKACWFISPNSTKNNVKLILKSLGKFDKVRLL